MRYQFRVVPIVAFLFSLSIGGAEAQLSQGEKNTIFIGPVKVNEGVAASATKSGRSNGLQQLAKGPRAVRHAVIKRHSSRRSGEPISLVRMRS